MEINGIDLDKFSEEELLHMYENILEAGSNVFYIGSNGDGCVCGPNNGGAGHGTAYCYTYAWCNYSK